MKQRESNLALERESAFQKFVNLTYPEWKIKGRSHRSSECAGDSTDANPCYLYLTKGLEVEETKIVEVQVKNFVSFDGEYYWVVYSNTPLKSQEFTNNVK